MAPTKINCLCLGPTGCGKTMILKRLQAKQPIDITMNTVPTVGTNLVSIQLNERTEITIREIGGSMAPMWNSYYQGINKIIFVADASNLCQISAAGVLFYSILTEPLLRHCKVLLILSKMDASYRQMRNEALLMLQINRLKREITQSVTVSEVSAVTSIGIDNIKDWLLGKDVKSVGAHDGGWSK